MEISSFYKNNRFYKNKDAVHCMALYGVYLRYKILQHNAPYHGVIFDLIWTPYNYTRRSGVSARSLKFRLHIQKIAFTKTIKILSSLN